MDALLNHGFDVCVFSIALPLESAAHSKNQCKVVFPKRSFGFLGTGLASKIAYLFSLPELKRCIKDFEPDVLHAHYASSYGLLGALSGFSPFFISVWGSDILAFPNKSFLHHKLLKYSLNAADRVFATSNLLESEVQRLFSIEATVISFGIDCDVFYPHRTSIYYSENELVIGSIKSMEKIYRMDWIIKAFAEVQRLRPNASLRLLLVGGGSQLDILKALASEICSSDTYTFTGKVAYSEIPELTAQLDIFVHAAINESFGVSTLEAASCGKPAVVCNSGGANEVVLKNDTALLYDEYNFDSFVSQLLILVDDASLRIRMGKNARSFVEHNFDWKNNVHAMINSYQDVLG